MLRGDTGMYRYTAKSGDRMIAFLEPIKTTGWSVATIVYEDEILAPARKVLMIMGGDFPAHAALDFW